MYIIENNLVYKKIINGEKISLILLNNEKIIKILNNYPNILFQYQKFNIESGKYELNSENQNDFNIEIIFNGITVSDTIPFEDGGFILTPSENGKYLIKVNDGNIFSELEIEVVV